jgi:hypothetical protein
MAALLAFTLRMITKLPAMGGEFGLDDLAITVAMVSVRRHLGQLRLLIQ